MKKKKKVCSQEKCQVSSVICEVTKLCVLIKKLLLGMCNCVVCEFVIVKNKLVLSSLPKCVKCGVV